MAGSKIMDHAELLRLGTLLHSHSWRDSREWALALGELGTLSDGDVEIVVGAAEAPSQRHTAVAPSGAS